MLRGRGKGFIDTKGVPSVPSTELSSLRRLPVGHASLCSTRQRRPLVGKLTLTARALLDRPLVDGDQIAHLRPSQRVCRRRPRQTTRSLVGLQPLAFVQLESCRAERPGYEGIRLEVRRPRVHVSLSLFVRNPGYGCAGLTI